jgi:hypothetical protein
VIEYLPIMCKALGSSEKEKEKPERSWNLMSFRQLHPTPITVVIHQDLHSAFSLQSTLEHLMSCDPLTTRYLRCRLPSLKAFPFTEVTSFTYFCVAGTVLSAEDTKMECRTYSLSSG